MSSPRVTSRALYAGLRDIIAPVAKQAGFRRLKSGMLGFTRPEGARHLSFWFQCDKYGWFDDFGSRFTLEFQLSRSPEPGAGGFRERFAQLLSPGDLEVVRSMNNQVLAALPEPSANNVVNLLGPDAREWFLQSYRPAPEPYNPNHDPWLNYFTPADVEMWGRFFRDRLTAMLDEFVRRVPAAS